MGGMDGMNGMGTTAPGLSPLGWGSFARAWQLEPWWLLVAVLLLAGYGAGLATCRRHGVRAVHPVRVASFAAGAVLLVLTVSSGIGVYAMALMWMHMIEHLMLIMVVPALLVLGHPLTVLRAAAAARGHGRRVDAVLHGGPVAVLTHPLTGFLFYTAVIVGTHLTSFMDRMAMHPWLMGAEQVLYLVSGYVFLLPLIGEEPIRWQVPELARIGLVLLGMTPDTVVGIVLMQATHSLFPMMAAMHPPWALSGLADQRVAGALMWAGGDGLMMTIGVGLTVAVIARPRSTNLLGQRLESVRRTTLAAQVSRGTGDATSFDAGTDVDDDDAMLAAYNRMLGRLNEPGPQRTPHTQQTQPTSD
jgi:putative copper resistance protein D